jgi:hypothetical protein
MISSPDSCPEMGPDLFRGFIDEALVFLEVFSLD